MIQDARFWISFRWITFPSSERVPTAYSVQTPSMGSRLALWLEGVWTEYAVGTLSEDGKVIQRKEIQKRATWIIIKNKGEYQVLNEYGEQNKFIASFTRTSQKNAYMFNAFYSESKDHIKVEAILVNGNRLEMAYDAPPGIFEENYREILDTIHIQDPDKKLTLHWQFNWLKSFPND